MMVVLPILCIVFFNTTLTILSGQKFGRCMPVSLMACSFSLYISQFVFHTFFVGYLFLVCVAIFTLPLLVINWKKRGELRSIILSPGFFVFLIILIFVLIWDFHRRFQIFDEFYHWGMMIKECLRLDSFYSVAESRLVIHKDYPPFLTLLEVFWCKLSGGYSEMRASSALHLLVFSTAFLPVSEDVLKEGKAVRHYVLSGVLLIFIGLSLIFALDPWTPRGTTSILADIPEAVLFAYAMYLIFSKQSESSRFGRVAFLLTNAALLLTKQVGIGFSLVICFYGITSAIFDKEHDKYRRTIRRCLGYSSVLIVSLVSLFIWNGYIRSIGISGQFNLGQISIRAFYDALTGATPGLQHDTIINFIVALFKKPIGSTELFPVTYVSAFLILISVIILYRIVFSDWFSRKQAVLIGAAFGCCTAGYAFVMMVLYTFCFNEIEMRNLSSFERYMASYILGQALLLFFIGMVLLRKKQINSRRKKTLILAAALFVCVLAPTNLYYFCPQVIQGNAKAAYENEANYVSSLTEEGSVIYTVYNVPSTAPNDFYGAYQTLMVYYTENRSFPWEMDYYQADLQNEEVLNGFIQRLSYCDYLYVRDTTETFSQVMSSYLDEGEIQANSVYEITFDNGLFSLTTCQGET